MPALGKGDRATHDIVLTIGSTNYGFMLWKDKNGKKAWKVYDSPTLIPQFTQSEPGYGNYDPTKEIVKTQTDWHGGFGLTYFNGTPRYPRILGILDARWRGRLILPPAVTQTGTNTSSPPAALTDPGVKFCEYNDTWYHGTTNILYSWDGTKWVSAKDFGSSAITDICAMDGLMYIALGGSTNYQATNGTTYYAASHASSKAKYFTYLAGTSPILFKAITPDEAKSSTTPHKDLTPPALTAGTPTAGGSVTDGTHSYKVTFYWVTGTIETAPSAASSQITCGTGNNTVPLSSIPVHPTDSTAQRRIYRTAAGDTGNYLLLATIADNTTTTYSDTTADGSLGAAAPTATNTDPWSSAYNVGDSETDITNLHNFRNLAYAGKEEGLYSITTGGTVTPIVTDFRLGRDTLNFKYMAVSQNKLCFNIGKRGLFVYDGTNLEAIGWDIYASGLSDVTSAYKSIAGLAASHDFLYVIASSDGGTGSVICTVREEDIDGTTDWRWHCIATLTMDTPVTAAISSKGITAGTPTNPWLWIGGDDSTPASRPEYIKLPNIGQYPEDDSGCAYPTSEQANFKTCKFDMGFRLDRKLFTAIDVHVANVSADKKVNVRYQVDGGSLSSSSYITSGPVGTIYPNTAGREIQVDFGIVTNSSTSSPQILGIAVRAILRARRRKIFEFAVLVADNVMQITGVADKNPASLLATQLKNADDPTVQTGVVTLYDRDNTSWNVVFESMTDEEVYDEVNKRPVRVFYIRAVEANVS